MIRLTVETKERRPELKWSSDHPDLDEALSRRCYYCVICRLRAASAATAQCTSVLSSPVAASLQRFLEYVRCIECAGEGKSHRWRNFLHLAEAQTKTKRSGGGFLSNPNPNPNSTTADAYSAFRLRVDHVQCRYLAIVVNTLSGSR
jgi:hypothetical protein